MLETEPSKRCGMNAMNVKSCKGKIDGKVRESVSRDIDFLVAYGFDTYIERAIAEQIWASVFDQCYSSVWNDLWPKASTL